MTSAQAALGLIFVVMLAAFVWGRWRFDFIAVAGLTAAVACGLVSPDAAFRGFGEPAVVTVAAVLILTRAVAAAGMFDRLAAWAVRGARSPAGQTAALCGLTAAASMVMNNIGALALFLPAALSLARRHGLPPGFFPLSLSYAALLGGMATLIGTPANLLVSGFRAQAVGEGFSFFAFAPVGVPLAVVGVAYLTWRARLRGPTPAAANDEGPPPVVYDVELTVSPGSPLIGRPTAALADYGRIILCGVVEADDGRFLPGEGDRPLRIGDALLAQADADALLELTGRAGLTADRGPVHPDHALTEVVVAPNALAQGSCAAALELEERYGVRLVAAARQGRRFDRRLAQTPLFIGDVLMLRGLPERTAAAAADLGCL
ncbi:MAG TPA: SLC13 family permease, partial [Azospirillaceae bacterium]|nr:SLC13 family permease [Azospirillaceae bacterium]